MDLHASAATSNEYMINTDRVARIWGLPNIPSMGNRSCCLMQLVCAQRLSFLAGTIRTDSLADSSSTMQGERVRRHSIEERV